MSYKLVTPLSPQDALQKLADALRQMNAKIEHLTRRSLKVKIKTGFMTSVSIQANLTETPYGSIVEFTSPELFKERLVDEAFFGSNVATTGQMELQEKVESIINDLKASIDGLNEEEARNIVGLRTSVKFLTKCPHCGSTARKGFKCAHCNSMMVEFE